MLTCETCEILIADALIDELSVAQEQQLKQHLSVCDSCRSLFDELSATGQLLRGGVMKSDRIDAPLESDTLDQLWDRLQPALDRIDADRLSQAWRHRFLPYLTGAVAMAAGLLVFVFVFDLSIQPRQPSVELSESAGNQLEESPELMAYLRRVETLLLTVANSESGRNAQPPIGQGFARSMAREAGFMTANLGDQFNTGQSRLLKDIEFMLLQIANLEEGNMNEGVRLLQRFIEDNSILFRIRLMEIRQSENVI